MSCSHLVWYFDFWMVGIVDVSTEKLHTEVAQMSLISFLTASKTDTVLEAISNTFILEKRFNRHWSYFASS